MGRETGPWFSRTKRKAPTRKPGRSPHFEANKMRYSQTKNTLPHLRDYQQSLYEKIGMEYSKGNRAVLAVAPTGSGKGTLITYVVGKTVAKGNRVVFLVNRRELVKDMSKRLYRLGIEHGIIMGAKTRSAWLPVQIASIDTLRNRQLPGAQLVIIDEAHFAASESWLGIIERYRQTGAYFLETTATPIRLDGKGLGCIADVLLMGPSVANLMDRGDLVRPRYFAPSIPDLTGVHTAHGDFNQAELAGLMDNSTLIGDVVENWAKAAHGRPTVAFCVNRKHSANLVSRFIGAGIAAIHADGETPDAERDAIWAKLASGHVQVVCSVGIISYGWDVPAVSCAIMARPTQSLALYLQQGGRILRPHETKADATLIDHAGNILRHGFLEDDRTWTLEDAPKKSRKDREELPEDKLPRVCPVTACSRVCRPTERVCPGCGYVFSVVAPQEIEERAGTIQEIDRKTYYALGDYQQAAGAYSDDAGVQNIITRASSRGWKPGAVHVQTKLLLEARNKYRQALGSEPKPHWNIAVLNSIVEVQSRKNVSS